MLAFFFQRWEIPLPWGGMAGNPHPGHRWVEATTVLGLATAGSLMGGWWWNAAGKASRLAGAAGGWAILALAAAGLGGWVGRELYCFGLGLWLAGGLGATLWQWRRRQGAMRMFFFLRKPWNAGFFAVWALVLAGADALMLRDSPGGWLAGADFIFGRLLNHIFITAAVWFLLAWHDRWLPAAARWTGWAVVMVVPLVVVVDAMLWLMWGKSLHMLFGELEVGGRFEMERALRAGGVQFTAGTAGIALAAVLGAAGVFFLCRALSRRLGCTASPWSFCIIGGTAWLLYQADQAAGIALKSRAWRWWEMKVCSIRMTPVWPEPGMASFAVALADPQPAVPPPPPAQAPRPDVFIIVVETLRGDALRPAAAPFLCRWRDEECMRLGETFAASNATHLSWFSMFSGRFPIHWESGRQAGRLAFLPAALKSAGCRIEARLAADYHYMDMVRTSFGDPHEIDVLENLDEGSRERVFQTPERETRLLDRVRHSVAERPAGGSMHIIALDSPHYPYKWAAKFDPPLKEYEENPMFPLRPSGEEVRLIVNRYWNSVAWIDHLIGGFAGWLKEQGRYDSALIIVTGDHGEEFKEQGSWFHCSALNPQQTRVPLLIKLPSSMGRGPAAAEASHLDIAPTVLDVLGFDPAGWAGLPGISLLRPEKRTIALGTHYAGKTGEAMLFIRDGWQASFGWRNYWEPQAPDVIWLERIQSPAGPLDDLAPAKCLPLLREKFPDAFGRVLESAAAR